MNGELLPSSSSLNYIFFVLSSSSSPSLWEEVFPSVESSRSSSLCLCLFLSNSSFNLTLAQEISLIGGLSSHLSCALRKAASENDQLGKRQVCHSRTCSSKVESLSANFSKYVGISMSPMSQISNVRICTPARPASRRTATKKKCDCQELMITIDDWWWSYVRYSLNRIAVKTQIYLHSMSTVQKQTCGSNDSLKPYWQ